MSAARLVLEHFAGGGGALLHAAETEREAAQARALALEAEEQERVAEQRRLQVLARSLGELAARSMDTRMAAIASLADVVESAVLAILPTLAQQGFAAELSAAIKDLIVAWQNVQRGIVGAPALTLCRSAENGCRSSQ